MATRAHAQNAKKKKRERSSRGSGLLYSEVRVVIRGPRYTTMGRKMFGSHSCHVLVHSSREYDVLVQAPGFLSYFLSFFFLRNFYSVRTRSSCRCRFHGRSWSRFMAAGVELPLPLNYRVNLRRTSSFSGSTGEGVEGISAKSIRE